ncbi:MAG: hypothetical protein ACRELB_04865 [Polyangiaceae bacterium]
MVIVATGCTLATAKSGAGGGSDVDGGVSQGGDPDGVGGGDPGTDGDPAVSDAGWNDNGCVTTAAGAQVVFGFDDGIAGWFDDPTSSPHGTVGGTLDDGVTCPGVLTYTVPFTGYGQKALVDFNWGYTVPGALYGAKLHFSVKIVLPGGGGGAGAYQALLLIQPMMLWNDWSEGDYDMFEYVNPTLADGQWHDVVIPLEQDGGTFLQAVDGFRFQVQTQASEPSDAGAGGASPQTVEYMFDDVWLE